jgi:hypothetical protein
MLPRHERGKTAMRGRMTALSRWHRCLSREPTGHHVRAAPTVQPSPRSDLLLDELAKLDPTTEYAREPAPLGARAALVGAFVSGGTAAAVAARRAGVRLPSRFDPADVAAIGVATFKLSRILTKSRVTSFARAPFTELQGSAGYGEVEESARGSGLRRAIGELVVCPYCVGVWIGAGLTGGLVVAPRATRAVSAALSAVALADALQLANRAAEDALAGRR